MKTFVIEGTVNLPDREYSLARAPSEDAIIPFGNNLPDPTSLRIDVTTTMRRQRPSPIKNQDPAYLNGTIDNAADFGAALRSRRKELGHTQAEVAALCHVGVRFLSELERGKPTAEIGRALKVARRLGLRLCAVPRDAAPVGQKSR